MKRKLAAALTVFGVAAVVLSGTAFAQDAEPTVKSVNEGAAIANVEVDVAGQRLVASITVEAARELGLEEGKAVTAIIKASDVILAAD